MIQNPTILSNYSIFVTETFKDFQCDTNTNMCKKIVHMYWNISTESHANRKKEEKRALLRREMSLQKFWFRVFGCGCGSVIHRYIYTVVPFLFPPPTYCMSCTGTCTPFHSICTFLFYFLLCLHSTIPCFTVNTSSPVSSCFYFVLLMNSIFTIWRLITATCTVIQYVM